MQEIGKLDHVALRIKNSSEAVRFFQNVFGMSVVKVRNDGGTKSSVWLSGGIQLIEDSSPFEEGMMDHVCFLVADIEKTIRLAERFGALPAPERGVGWFRLREGLVIELKAGLPER